MTLLLLGCEKNPSLLDEEEAPPTVAPYPGPCSSEYVYYIEDELIDSHLERHTYDDSGNLIITQREGGEKSDNFETQYIYDTQNRLQISDTFSRPEGTHLSHHVLTYHDNGTVHTEEKWGSNSESGEWTYHAYVTYDSQGNLLTEAIDRAGTYYDPENSEEQSIDGIFDRTSEHVYDDQGNEILLQEDTDGDGAFDVILVTEFDEYNNPVLESSDINGDGTAESTNTNTYTYDDAGKMLSWERDTYSDGEIDNFVEYAYDDDGNLREIKEDWDVDGVVDRTTTYLHDSDGRVFKESIYLNRDGIYEETTSYLYDEFGLKEKATKRGSLDDIERFVRDPNGNLLRETYLEDDVWGDEREEHLEEYVYEYDCWG